MVIKHWVLKDVEHIFLMDNYILRNDLIHEHLVRWSNNRLLSIIRLI